MVGMMYEMPFAKKQKISIFLIDTRNLRYQFAAYQYGKDFMKFHRERYQRLVDEMRNEK